jgi:hypothetical protein
LVPQSSSPGDSSAETQKGDAVSADANENLIEVSMNLDLEIVRPFLERIRPHIDSGFADSQIDELVGFIEATPVEHEREMRLEVADGGSPTPLVVRVFMDDIDAPDLYFFTSAGLAEKIRNERDAFCEELGL